MTKTLEFAYETTHEIKVGDDETTFTLICKNEDLPVDLTTAKLITVKIGNRSGYLRGQLISIDSLANLPTGQLKFSLDKDTLANFPTGSYCLEVWVTDAQGTSIYPSGNPLNFIVTANIENSSGSNITTVAYDDFVEAMNKAASTIAKGDPGEGLDIKGQVTSVSALPATANEGDGYLVNEELYVYTSGAWKDCGTIQGPQGIQGKTGTGISSTTIQYQISNSATTAPTGTWSNDIVATTTANPYLWMKATLNYTDNTTKDFYLVSQKGDKGDKGDPGEISGSIGGSNLLLGTADWNSTNFNGRGTVTSAKFNALTIAETNADWNSPVYFVNDLNNRNLVNLNMPYTFSTYARNTSDNDIFISAYGSPQYMTNMYDSKTLLKAHGNWQRVSATFSFIKDVSGANLGIRWETGDTVVNGKLQFAGYKLERGSTATDWTPAPEEILTQADYAKIKAAIVALGGSLS